MANPLYNALMGQASQPMTYTPMFNQSPLMKIQSVMQAMSNPAQFVKQHFPDIPANIENDPNQILQYLQRTRNIPNANIQQIMSMFSAPT